MLSRILARANDTRTLVQPPLAIAYGLLWTLVHPMKSFVLVFQANFLFLVCYASYLVV